MILRTCLLLVILLPTLVQGHGKADIPETLDPDRLVTFPDTAEYLTLAVDLHTHSVFSDGHVWPRIRIEEAVRDGLDGIAITEHLEWRPHRADIPGPDLNRAYEDARMAAEDTEVIVIAGSEITREMPVGHINAIFISDANALFSVSPGAELIVDVDEYYNVAELWPAENALAAASRQGAFMFWNHPAWEEQQPDGIATPTEFHEMAFARGWIEGIEVSNGEWYSEEAFRIALDKNLAILGVSDIHGLIDWEYEHRHGAHRPVTLVFASARSSDAIREALRARRTVAWHEDLLLGRPEHVVPLLEATLVASEAIYDADSIVASLTLENRSSQDLLLENTSKFSFRNHGQLFMVPARESVELGVRTKKKRTEFPLTFIVRNALVAPRETASIRIDVNVAEAEIPRSAH